MQRMHREGLQNSKERLRAKPVSHAGWFLPIIDYSHLPVTRPRLEPGTISSPGCVYNIRKALEKHLLEPLAGSCLRRRARLETSRSLSGIANLLLVQRNATTTTTATLTPWRCHCNDHDNGNKHSHGSRIRRTSERAAGNHARGARTTEKPT